MGLELIPKGELHVHLFGGVPSDIVLKIMHHNNVNIDDVSGIKVPRGCSSLVDYLSPWKYFRKIPSSLEELDIIINFFF